MNHLLPINQGSFGTGTHRNAVPVLFLTTGTPFRSFFTLRSAGVGRISTVLGLQARHEYSNWPENAPKCAFRVPKNENFLRLSSPLPNARFCLFLHAYYTDFSTTRLRLVFIARCTIVHSAVLPSHVVRLSVRPSVRLSVRQPPTASPSPRLGIRTT